MRQRREAIDLAKEIYEFLKKNKSKEYSINKISNQFRAKFEITIKCLEFLRDISVINERRGTSKPNPERLFSINS